MPLEAHTLTGRGTPIAQMGAGYGPVVLADCAFVYPETGQPRFHPRSEQCQGPAPRDGCERQSGAMRACLRHSADQTFQVRPLGEGECHWVVGSLMKVADDLRLAISVQGRAKEDLLEKVD